MVSSTPAGSGLPIGLMPGALPSDQASRQTLKTTAMRLPFGQTQFGLFFIHIPGGRISPGSRTSLITLGFIPSSADHAAAVRGLMIQAPATTRSAINAGAMASRRLTDATAAVAAQPIDEKASVNVATREETWRRRNWLRLAWLRNQSWIAVAAVVAMTMPPLATSACQGESTARTATSGANTKAMTPSTASTLARRIKLAGTGAVATRSGASSPEIASQARPPASWPAAMTRTGQKQILRAVAAVKTPHSRTAGGMR